MAVVATVSLVMVGETIKEVSAGFEMSDEDAARILAWTVRNFPMPADPPPTPADYMEALARETLQTVMRRVVADEKERAFEVAKQAIADINAVPMAKV